MSLQRTSPVALFVACCLLAGSFAHGSIAQAGDYQIRPARVELKGNFAQAQLLVTGLDTTGAVAERSDDFTGKATYAVGDANIVTVSPTGRLLAVANGTTTVTVTVDGVAKPVEVVVSGVEATPVIGFDEQVLPVIAKLGCNSGACHASQHGKGGFTLSVFGFDPSADHAMLVRDRQQRRINFNKPEDSLFLMKPTLAVPHGGGKRLDAKSPEYEVLKAWVAGKAPAPRKEAPKVTSISVLPVRRVGEVGMTQQLQLIAHYSDNVERDVTAWARFDSMDDGMVNVTPQGVFTTIGKGQAPVMVRYDGQAEISMVVVPYGTNADLVTWVNHNLVDELAAVKFRELGITPSPLCDDATFLRRAFLDAIGTLPTVAEATAFIDSTDPDKRTKLIDRLLGLTGDPAQDIYNDKYAALWTLKWADLIRNSSDNVGDQGMWSLYNWMRESFRTNKPFDEFVRELVTAKGSLFSNGPANYFRIAKDPSELAEATSQLFLGVRLGCAKCHHHPFEKYSQADYYGFAAFFARVGNKGSSEFGIFGGENIVVVRSGGDVRHPRTGEIMKPTPLDGAPVDDPLDRRLPLAKWLTSTDNEAFSRNIVNRYMAFLLGRGLVDPVDDMRATNPPTNVELMNALSREVRSSGFNLKHLMRLIMQSRLYQLDSQPLPGNASDSRFYSHFLVKRLAAEPLLDAIDDTTASPTKYPNLPLGTRAIELPDTDYNNYFLMTFGKPKRTSVCDCDRVRDENLSQALHTLNGDIVAGKIADAKGRIATLLAAKKSHEEIVTELYLSTLSRRPSPAELAATSEFLAESSTPQECYQDLLWALLNSKQFLFVR